MKKVLIVALIVGGLMLPAAAFACGCSGNSYRTGTGPVTMEEAQQITERYLATIDNGRLQPGDIQLNGSAYLVEIVDENGKSVARMNIDMLSGAIRPVF